MVNALLTQLDKLKHRKNCLIMTTSNLSEAIGQSTRARNVAVCSASDADLGFGLARLCADNAFIDRADIKQYIDLCATSHSVCQGEARLTFSGARLRKSANCGYLLDSPLLPAGNHARRAGPGSGALLSSSAHEREFLLTFRLPFLVASDRPQDGRSLPLGGHERG